MAAKIKTSLRPLQASHPRMTDSQPLPVEIPPLIDPPTTAKTNIPKPVLCWHFLPLTHHCPSKLFSSSLYEPSDTCIRPDSVLLKAETTVSFSPSWIHRDCEMCTAVMHSSYLPLPGFPPSSYLSPSTPFFYVSWWPESVAQILPFLRIYLSPDTSVSPFPQFLYTSILDFCWKIFICIVGPYYHHHQLSLVNYHLSFSYQIKALPYFSQETNSYQTNGSYKPQNMFSLLLPRVVFSQRPIYRKTDKYVENMLFCVLDKLANVSSAYYKFWENGTFHAE